MAAAEKTCSGLRRAAATLLVAAGSLWGLCGCAGPVRYVEIDSQPPGATIYVDGLKRGVTRAEHLQLDFRADPRRRVLIQVVKPRYRPMFEYWLLDEVPEKKVFTMQAD